MAKSRNTVSYTADELRAKVAKGEDRTDWQKVDQTSTSEAAADSTDTSEWDWAKAALIIPAAKEHISLRIDSDVLTYVL